MNILTVLTNPTDEAGRYEVLWSNGVQRQGTVFVRIPFSIPSPDVAAELGALHHLLVRRAIFGHDRAGVGKPRKLEDGREVPGMPVELVVSRGQTKKLARGASAAKDEFFQLTRWLNVRFRGVSLKVSKDDQWVLPRARMHTEEIELERALDDVQVAPGVGDVLITWHTIDRFAQHLNNIDVTTAWHEFRKVLAACDYRIARGEDLDGAARERHGVDAVILYDIASAWNFVITPGDGGRRLPAVVTAYWQERKKSHLQRIESMGC